MIESEDLKFLKKALHDQIHSLAKKYNEVQELILSIDKKLNEKANLTSQYLEGSSTVNKLGSGNVSVSLKELIGTNTLFLTELAIGDTVNISNYSFVVESISSNTSALLKISSPIQLNNQIYTITKQSTKEVFTGLFHYGETNGSAFEGRVNEGSILEHYGRMSSPNDIVNVYFVKKAITPAVVAAKKAIQRTGDIVESSDALSPYDYIYNNCNLNFNNTTAIIGGDDDGSYQPTSWQYHGITSGDYNIVTRRNLTEITDEYKKINNIYAIVKKSYTGSSPSGIQLSFTPDFNNGINEYFTISGSVLTCIKSCVILFRFKASGTTTTGGDAGGRTFGMSASLSISGSEVDFDRSSCWTSSASNVESRVGGTLNLFTIHPILVGQTLSVTLNTNDSGGTSDLNSFVYSACMAIMSA